MLDALRRRWTFVGLLWRERVVGKWIELTWTVLYAGWAAWRSEFIKSADADRYQIPALLAHVSPFWGALVFSVILVVWVFEASLRVNKRLESEATELRKVDRRDLQNMLGGRFIGDTFMYPFGMTLVKQYKNAFELEAIRVNYERLQVRAPRNSLATLSMQFLNLRNQSGGFAFYILDERGAWRIDDIYGKIDVLLNDEAAFGLKLVTNAGFALAPEASLTVVVETWTK